MTTPLRVLQVATGNLGTEMVRIGAGSPDASRPNPLHLSIERHI
jgi:hypothetical protein